MQAEVSDQRPGGQHSQGKDTATSGSRLDAFLARHRGRVVFALCVLGAVRVFVFSAAFPLFNNVDEHMHYDAVWKFAHGHVPRDIELMSAEAARNIVFYASPEYFRDPDEPMVRPPVWTRPADRLLPSFEAAVARLQATPDKEGVQPPVYYAAAGLWYRLGEAVGMRGGYLIYWIRFLDVLVVAALVWVSHALLRKLYPTHALINMGAPLVIAFMPQDVYYSISNDVPSALLFTTAMFCAVLADRRSYVFQVLTGLAAAGAFLTKYTNAPIFAVVAVTLALRLWKARRGGYLRSEAARSAVLVVAALAPVTWWFATNYMQIGEISALQHRIDSLGWTAKSFSEMWNHPIFTPAGAAEFWRDLMTSFFRGEYIWASKALTCSACDLFYAISATLFLLAGTVVMLRGGRNSTESERLVDGLNLFAFAVSVLMLVAFSIRYDFDSCCYPSRAYPYFTSGRLIAGVTVPFLVIYLKGMDALLSALRVRLNRLCLLAAVMVVITACEVWISLGVFASPYNWFHML